jgi:hypothetical protein
MRFYETLKGAIIIGFGFGSPCLIIWFLFERLEIFLREGYNPTFQLVTFIPGKGLNEWESIKSIYDYISSTTIFQWDVVTAIVGWVHFIYDFILHLPIELWLLACWPIFSWIGFKISNFIKR